MYYYMFIIYLIYLYISIYSNDIILIDHKRIAFSFHFYILSNS